MSRKYPTGDEWLALQAQKNLEFVPEEPFYHAHLKIDGYWCVAYTIPGTDVKSIVVDGLAMQRKSAVGIASSMEHDRTR
jgi:hypothetical protein